MALNLFKKKQIIDTDLILELLSKEEPISRRANVLYICVRQAAGGRLRESQAIVRRAPARAPDPVLPVPPLGSLLLHSWLDTRVEKSTSTVIVPSLLLLLLLSEQLSASQDIFLPVTDNVNLMVAKELWSV